MPIRPENRRRYPKDWKAISARVRFERAGGRCECSGECGDDHDLGLCPARLICPGARKARASGVADMKREEDQIQKAVAEYLCFLLPFPPSVNGLFATDFRTRRRFATKRYQAWQTQAGVALLQQPHARLTGKVKVTYALGRPDKRKRDAFNYEKAISDLLVRHEIIQDDSDIDDGRIYWADDVKNGCRIEVEAL